MKKNSTLTVCPGCTCLCDDIEISTDSDTVTAQHACDKGQQWFDQAANRARNFNGLGHFVLSQPADLATALKTSAQVVEKSTAPLICGLAGLTTESQQAAWRLADRLRASIDTTFTDSGRASQFSLARVGKVTATLGEVATRSDLVIFWFCDPVRTHPRHLERYSNPAGGKPRKVIVIDEQCTETAKRADEFIEIPRSSAAAVLTTLRALAADLPLREEQVEQTTGHPISQWRELSQKLTQCQYGALFYGGVTPHAAFDLANDSLASLVRELNQVTRFVALAMRTDANAISAENVLAWSSGFSSAINLNRGYPRSDWLQYSAQSILSRRECDLILVASTRDFDDQLRRLGEMDRVALDHFENTKKIVLSETQFEPLANIEVQIAVGEPGWGAGGDYVRQDDIPLPLVPMSRPSNAPDLPAAKEVLEKILLDI